MTKSVNTGVMLSFRNPPEWHRPFVDIYRDELRLAQRAEELGFDTVWLTEHHFAEDGYSPSIIAIAAAIAARTEHIRIGFNLLLLPLHDAVRLAEDLATLDVISNGRIDVGLGQGYAVHEFAGFGIPRNRRLGRFLEGLDVLEGLWRSESFSYDGKHYQIENARLMPRPVQQPSPPLWIGATSAKAVARAGRRGANLLGLANPALQDIYSQARESAGLSLETANVLQLHWMHIAEDADAAWAEASASFHHLLSVYAEWGNAAATADGSSFRQYVPPLSELRDPAHDLIFDPLFGSAQEVAADLHVSLARVRTTHLALGVLPGMDPMLTESSMSRFMSDVVPRL